MERYQRPEHTMYFPLANEAGMKSSITPRLAGDAKLGQNTFLLQPVSAEELHNLNATRNFWLQLADKSCWSASGESLRQRADEMDIAESCKTKEVSIDIGVHRLQVSTVAVGLESVITSFVPSDPDTVELMQVVIRNSSEEPKTFHATAAIPMYGRSADNIRDHRHVTSLLHRILTTEYGVTTDPTMTFDERGHKYNRVLYYIAGCEGDGTKPVGFYPTVKDFIGEHGDYLCPQAVIENRETVPAGRKINGYEVMGGIRFREKTLRPGEECSYTVILGIREKASESENPEDTVNRVIEKYGTKACLDHALASTVAYWKERLNISFHSADEQYDRYMTWVSFQPMLRRIYGCSFLPHHDYGRGGRGWRDLWQDCLALLLMQPEGVRQMLVNNFGGVRIDGTNATIIGDAPGEFIADRNHITRVWMDHGVWPLMTTALYIEQTGDIRLLMTDVVYFADQQVERGTATAQGHVADERNRLLTGNGTIYQGTVLEHLLIQNVTAVCDTGEHCHCRLRGADWNDALDMAGERGESVAFTAAYAANLEKLAILIEELGQPRFSCCRELAELLADLNPVSTCIPLWHDCLANYCKKLIGTVNGTQVSVDAGETAALLRQMAAAIKAHIRDTEWLQVGDDAWFNGYYDNEGKQLEGAEHGIVKMMLTSQVFTVLSGTADETMLNAVIRSADRYLYCEKGGYRLNTDFGEELSKLYRRQMGRMFGFAYGQKENGAVFSHMAVMYAYALYQRNRVPEGYRVLDALYRQSSNRSESHIYPGIPEYFDAEGRGMYHYLTGAASWLLLTTVTQVYGVRGDHGNLCLAPKLVADQFDDRQQAGICLTWAGIPLHITYNNRDSLEYGRYRIGGVWIDGRPVPCSPSGVIKKEAFGSGHDAQNHTLREITVELI